MGLKKVIPLAIALWPIPVLNGLVVGVASSEEESVKGSVKVAVTSSVTAFAFYYLINEYVRRLPIIGDLLLLSGISVVGGILAVYLAVYLRVRSVMMALTREGLTIEYYARSLKDVERKVLSMDLGCSTPSYFIEGEGHVRLYFECREAKVEADVRKDWKYLKVRMEVKGKE